MDVELTQIIMSSAWTYTLVIALGLSVGSFVNVLVWRLPNGESILRPPSHCPSCNNRLRWFHNIPVLSYLCLRGRCAFCRTRISWVYPAVELICAGLYFGFFLRYGLSVTTLGFWYLSTVLIAVLFIDWQHKIIPNRLSYPTIVVGITVAFFSNHITWQQSVLGAACAFAGFVGIAGLGRLLFKKDSLGGGDIKLAAGLGAFLGIWKVLLVVVLSAAVGLVFSLIAMAVSSSIRENRIVPFGPFLAIAALIAGVWGDSILNFYIRTFIP
jgi:leader peptidase (prepilin peptidase)/N-methyltransferase